MFVQNWNTDINDSTCVRYYFLYANFRFQPYLNPINLEKNVLHCHVLESSNRLEVKTGRWHKPVPLNESKINVELV